MNIFKAYIKNLLYAVLGKNLTVAKKEKTATKYNKSVENIKREPPIKYYELNGGVLLMSNADKVKEWEEKKEAYLNDSEIKKERQLDKKEDLKEEEEFVILPNKNKDINDRLDLKIQLNGVLVDEINIPNVSVLRKRKSILSETAERLIQTKFYVKKKDIVKTILFNDTINIITKEV